MSDSKQRADERIYAAEQAYAAHPDDEDAFKADYLVRLAGLRKPCMSDGTIRSLAFVHYDAAMIDARLADLASLLHRCAADVPACAPAALSLTRLRRRLRHAMSGIDDEVTAAVLAAESLPPAPF